MGENGINDILQEKNSCEGEDEIVVFLCAQIIVEVSYAMYFWRSSSARSSKGNRHPYPFKAIGKVLYLFPGKVHDMTC